MAVLHNISTDIVNSIDHYYSLLSKTGYLSQCKVDGLIVFTFIENFLSDFDYMLSNENFELLNKVVNCLSGNCIIPYSDKSGMYEGQEIIPNYNLKDIRVSEDTISRNTEESEFRIKA